MTFKMTKDVAGDIYKPSIHGESELYKKSGPPGFFSKLMDPLGLRKKIGGKLCGSKLFNPGGEGVPAAQAAQTAVGSTPPVEQAAMPITPAAPATIGNSTAVPTAAAPMEPAPVAMHKKNKLTDKPGAPWRVLTEKGFGLDNSKSKNKSTKNKK
jgi:hypothetical protein